MPSTLRSPSPPPTYALHFFDLAPTATSEESVARPSPCVTRERPSERRRAVDRCDWSRRTSPTVDDSEVAGLPLPAAAPRRQSRRNAAIGGTTLLSVAAIAIGLYFYFRSRQSGGSDTAADTAADSAATLFAPSTKAWQTTSAATQTASTTATPTATTQPQAKLGPLALGNYDVALSKQADSCQNGLVVCGPQRAGLWSFYQASNSIYASFHSDVADVRLNAPATDGTVTMLLPPLFGTRNLTGCSIETSVRFDLQLSERSFGGQASYTYRNRDTHCLPTDGGAALPADASCQCDYTIAGRNSASAVRAS